MSEATPSSAEGRETSSEWLALLTEGHAPLVRARRIFRYVPSAPRCKVCNNPFAGIGGRVVALAGYRRSRKNPNLCGRCCDALPVGGAEIDIAVLFADVRGSAPLGQRDSAADFAGLLIFVKKLKQFLVGAGEVSTGGSIASSKTHLSTG